MSRLNLTNAQTGDGLDAANDQPAKTLTKRTIDFIALCTAIVWNDPRLIGLVVWVAGMLVGLGAFQ